MRWTLAEEPPTPAEPQGCFSRLVPCKDYFTVVHHYVAVSFKKLICNVLPTVSSPLVLQYVTKTTVSLSIYQDEATTFSSTMLKLGIEVPLLISDVTDHIFRLVPIFVRVLDTLQRISQHTLPSNRSFSKFNHSFYSMYRTFNDSVFRSQLANQLVEIVLQPDSPWRDSKPTDAPKTTPRPEQSIAHQRK